MTKFSSAFLPGKADHSYDYTIAIAGNPNVGKSTIFNQITGMHQHTGNWPGKTVANATGYATYQNKRFRFVDIPGTYSLLSHSEEEEIARDYICFSKPDVTVVIVDATCLERSLNLVYQTMEITQNLIVCVNLLDEAKKKGISIDLDHLSVLLGVPVVGTIARKKKTITQLLQAIYLACENPSTCNPRLISYAPFLESCIHTLEKTIQEHLAPSSWYLTRWIALKLLDGDALLTQRIQEELLGNVDLEDYLFTSHLTLCDSILEEQNLARANLKDFISESIVAQSEKVCQEVLQQTEKSIPFERKVDRILTSKRFGIPIMLLFLGLIFWLTIVGANYPSHLLSILFDHLRNILSNGLLSISCPDWLFSLLMDGIYGTVTWIVAVMLPPMAIFFPLFTLLEDCGFLPRIAFNLDQLFCRAGSSRKAISYHVHGSDKVGDFFLYCRNSRL